MSLVHLEPAPGAVDPPELAGPDHPMRKVTRQVAFENAWDATRAAKVAELFDSMAPNWTADHDAPERVASLRDALDRGQVGRSGSVLELGSGTGLGTRVLREICDGPIVALDIAAHMLHHAPPRLAHRVRADAAALPIRSGAVDTLVLVNALLFPMEADRVLAPEGALIWVNTLGPSTPIHLPAEDVLTALPGQWSGTASRAGTGTWLVSRRSDQL